MINRRQLPIDANHVNDTLPIWYTGKNFQTCDELFYKKYI